MTQDDTERALRVDLAACYRLVALYGWDDLVFTHISARLPGPEHHFLINPYGMLFDEITASSLVKVDAQGNALGGVRSPQVDAPVARLSGGGQSGESFCGLFGTTAPFDAATLASLYPDRQTQVDRWNSAIDAAVAAGTLLAPDAEALRAALG